MSGPLYRRHELAFRTQYGELKERARAGGPLLAGTPGTLYERRGTGHAHWYRVHYPLPGVQAEEWVGAGHDAAALAAARERVAFARWMAEQVGHLRRLGFQVGDKTLARVLVELHNRGLLGGGLVVTGTLAYLAWLNELGAVAVAHRTLDVDLARRLPLKLAAPTSLLDALRATRLPFAPIPGLPSDAPSTSFKLPGRDGLRVDLLAPGRALGAPVALPELASHAQAVPHYAWLLDDAATGAILAGGHCVPVRLPAPARFVWHKVYSSAGRAGAPEKAEKDLVQAAVLAAIVAEDDDTALAAALRDAPPALVAAARRRRAAWVRLLAAHPETIDQVERALA